ncbi:hypothetical protein [Methylobacter tundripaludum]|uniref:hypothetical protein n=1 Tax=Methylobacter tundripaludum TaxID=173365 RepID=UPI0011B09F9D|nr:hypothetical protein [Methylobacter tundripaludum]
MRPLASDRILLMEDFTGRDQSGRRIIRIKTATAEEPILWAAGFYGRKRKTNGLRNRFFITLLRRKAQSEKTNSRSSLPFALYRSRFLPTLF